MSRALLAILMFSIGLAAPNASRAQDAALDPAIARQQWNEHVLRQRDNVEQMRRERRLFVVDPPTQEQLADDRVRRALDDPALMPGDVVVTRRGRYRYRGTPDNRERQPDDFVLIETTGRQ